jgi:hypothetical protein
MHTCSTVSNPNHSTASRYQSVCRITTTWLPHTASNKGLTDSRLFNLHANFLDAQQEEGDGSAGGN